MKIGAVPFQMMEEAAMTSLENLIPHFISFREAGQLVALVTLIGNTGSSPRPPGSQMVVSEDGHSVGYLTGGCAESVIISEAIAAIRAQKNRQIRLGVGSPYMDIRLPCGAGIDIYIDVGVCDEEAQQISQSLESRLPIVLDTCLNTGNHQVFMTPPPCVQNGVFRRWYLPRRRLLIAGVGPNTEALTSLGTAADYEVSVLSPDRRTLNASICAGADSKALTSPAVVHLPATDAWTAAVLLFHEHEWESAILKQLLRSDCFYIGALGSRKTHDQRITELKTEGFGNETDRIHGPVGMNIGAITAPEIAISILAEVTLAYRNAGSLSLETSTSTYRPCKSKNPNNGIELA
ncbi:XdhC family protein [Marinobacter sp. R17]|nr:XdhC family protein [Marinobacter sp. R17]